MLKPIWIGVVLGSWVSACASSTSLPPLLPPDRTLVLPGEKVNLSSWNLTSTLVPLELINPHLDRTDAFGLAVDLDGDHILVGDPGDLEGIGAAYLFEVETGQLVGTFPNPSPAPGDHFGFAVALHKDRVLIGAPNDSWPGAYQGGRPISSL